MMKPASLFRTLKVSPLIAAMFGLVIVVLVLATPTWLFSRFVDASGLPLMFSAARPPLGDTARALAAIFGGLGTTGVTWLALKALRRIVKPARIAPRGARISPTVITPRASAAATVPIDPARAARSPIFAGRDLGAPFMSDEIIANAKADTAAPQRTELELGAFLTAPATEPELVVDTVKTIEATTQRNQLAALAETAEVIAFTASSTSKISDDEEDTAPTLSELLLRLETALARQAQGSAPLGDILSLRRTLGQF